MTPYEEGRRVIDFTLDRQSGVNLLNFVLLGAFFLARRNGAGEQTAQRKAREA